MDEQAPKLRVTSDPADVYFKPRPRPPKGPGHTAQIRVQNRRRAYLDRHPDYFESMEHELADPLLYDALVRRFQTAEEREKEGREKGFSRVLEVDLLRGEAKLSRLAAESSQEETSSYAHARLPSSFSPSSVTATTASKAASGGADSKHNYQSDGDVLGLDDELPPDTQEEGRERWEEFLRTRFILGQDDDFDYVTVDEDDAYDVIERRDEEDAWFNAESPGWIEGGDGEDSSAKDKKQLEGETGIQDF